MSWRSYRESRDSLFVARDANKLPLLVALIFVVTTPGHTSQYIVNIFAALIEYAYRLRTVEIALGILGHIHKLPPRRVDGRLWKSL